MNKIKNKEDVITDTTGIQRIIKDYCEQLYINKLDNLKEIDKFPEMRHFKTRSGIF